MEDCLFASILGLEPRRKFAKILKHFASSPQVEKAFIEQKTSGKNVLCQEHVHRFE